MRYSRVFLAVALPTVASAQHRTLTIAGDSGCAQCRIEVRKMATIVDVPGAQIGRDSRLVRDSLGRFIVVVEPGPRIAIFDARGAFVEFLNWRSSRRDSSARGVIPLIDWAGDLHVFDGFTQWQYPRSGQLATNARPLEGFVPLGTGSAWSVGVPAPSALPHPTFVALASFVGPTPLPRVPLSSVYRIDSVRSNEACRDCADVALSVTPVGFSKGTLWIALADRYRLDLLDGWGKRLRASVTVTSPWLPTRDAAAYQPGRTLPEAPRITAIAFDQNGCTRPQETWQRVQFGPNPCERLLWVAGLTYADSGSADESKRYYTVVDAVGITAPYVVTEASVFQDARMVARTQLPGRLDLFGPGALYQRRQLPNGKWVIDVYLLGVRKN
jgi:hypothetical protein